MFKFIELKEKNKNDIVPVIKSLEVALTSKCNYNCPYCGAYKTSMTSERRLRLHEIIEILEQCHDLERVKLSGGEVTLCFNDCLEICNYCKNRGIVLQINTNATLLNYQKIIALKEAGLDTIHISFNFTDPKKYSEYYNVSPSMFYKLVENIELCTQYLNCVVESILFLETIHSLTEINHFIYDLGVRIYELQSGIPQNTWKTEIESRAIIIAALEKLFKTNKEDMHIYMSCFELTDLSNEYSEFIQLTKKKNVHFTECIDGQYQFHLHDNGDLIMCELGYPEILGNVFTESIISIMSKPNTYEKTRNFVMSGGYCNKRCIL